jgi:hypothetical protein
LVSITRVHKYASCSNECFILALIYIDRLIQRNNFLLTELNVHRVVITAVLLAAKFFDDAYYNNAYYAKVGGVLVSEINGLEVDFLFRINFSLRVTPDEFDKYRAELLSHLTSSPPQLIATVQQGLADAIHDMSLQVTQQPCVQDAMQAEPTGIATSRYEIPAEVVHMTSHITPSPRQPANGLANDIMSNLSSQNSVATQEEIVAANSHMILQSLQNVDSGGYPVIHRSNSMTGIKSTFSGAPLYHHRTQSNVSLPIQQRCTQNAFRSAGQPLAYPADEQYLRFLMENQQWDALAFQQANGGFTQHQVDSSSYMGVVSNEARRLVAQGQILAGLSGAAL